MTVPVGKVPLPRYPLNNITPFTYRDGATFLEIIEALRDYIADDLLESVNAVIDEINEKGEQQAIELGILFNDLTLTVTTKIEELESGYNEFKGDIGEQITDFIGDVNSQISDFTDAITILVNSISNKTGSWGYQFINLGSDYEVQVDPLWPTDHPITYVFSQDSTGGHSVTFGAGIENHWGTVVSPEPGEESTVELYPIPGGGWVVRQEGIVDARSADLVAGTGDNLNQLNRLFASGTHILFPVKQTVTVDTSTTHLTIPDNTVIDFNGTVLKFVNQNDKSSVRIYNNVKIDGINYEASVASPTTRGIEILGSNVEIGSVVMTSPGPSSTGSYLRRSIAIGSQSLKVWNVKIGYLSTDHFDYSLAIWWAENVEIGRAEINRAKQGIVIRDAKHVKINGGTFMGNAISSRGVPGENAILMEATKEDGGLEFIYVKDFHCLQAGEHGFRVGGQFIARNIFFENCRAEFTGAGGIGGDEPENHGGCGFKVLGATTNLSGSAVHENIYFINCSVGMLARSRQKDNFAGFNIGKSKHVILDNPVVSIYRGTAGNPVYNGIEIIGSRDVVINNPTIVGAEASGILIYGIAPSSGSNWGGLINVTVNGGVIENCLYGVRIASIYETIRRVAVKDVLIAGCSRGFTQLGSVDPSLINRCSFSGQIYSSERVAENSSAWEMNIIYDSGTDTGDTFDARIGSLRKKQNTVTQMRRDTGWTDL